MNKWKEKLIEFSKANRSVLVLLAIVLVLAGLTGGTFLSPRNLTNLTRQVAINGILAVGMTYVILIGGIDLSIGSVVALSGVVAGLLQVNAGLAQWEGALGWLGTGITVLAAVAVGLLSGIFNGFMITRHRIAPFIITLGMMVISRGIALILSHGAAIAPLGEQFNTLGQEYFPPLFSAVCISIVGLVVVWKSVGWADRISALFVTLVAAVTFFAYRGLPIPVVIFAFLGLAGILVLQKTRLGRYVLAMGGNPEAAWLAGVPIQSIAFGIYVFMGALAGLSGAILASRLNGALPTSGELFELDAIAAVVIGGTSLLGGVGTVQGSILGAFFIGVLNNGMSLLDVSEFYQKVIKGVIIIMAVWFDMRQNQSGRTRK